MKFQSVVVAALCSTTWAVSSQVELRATTWLKEHTGENPDELAELKSENPDAYALVKALLTKRSLGLLDPKHPTASFAAPPPKDDTDQQQSGAAVYAKFATTEKEQLALAGQPVTPSANVPYPEASQAAVPYPEAAGASQNWMNWKPNSNDDDAMVQNVLGAVADLTKGKSLRGKPEAQDESPLQAEASQLEQDAPATTTLAPVQAESVPAQVEASPVPEAAPAQAEQPQVSQNSLTSFTFDDSQSATTATTTAPASKGANPLASWLGVVKPHVQTAAVASNPQQKPSNPYLMDLQ